MKKMLERGYDAAAVALLSQNCDDEEPEQINDPYIVETNFTENKNQYIDAIDGVNLAKLSGLLHTDLKNRQYELSLACNPKDSILSLAEATYLTVKVNLTERISKFQQPEDVSYRVRYFNFGGTDKWRNLLLTCKLGAENDLTTIKVPKECEDCFNGYSKILQVQDYILSFKPDRDLKVHVYKLDQISSSKIKLTELKAIPRFVTNFAVTLFQEKDVFLTGGQCRGDSKAVFQFNLKQSKWLEAPSLNQARENHSCCELNGRLYVCGGNRVKSIEMFEVGVDKAWTTIATNQIISRTNAAIAVSNANSFAVFAGDLTDTGRNDGYLFNVNTREVKPILGSANDFKFYCRSEVHKFNKQTFVVLGMTRHERLHKVKLFTNKSFNFFETRSIANYSDYKE